MNLTRWHSVLGKEPPAVTLIAGPEAGLRRRALAALRDALGAGADLERYGTDVTPGELADAVQTLPLFGAARLAVVEGDALPAELTDTVLKLLPGIRPPNHLAVVLERLDRRSRLSKELQDSTVECEPLKEADLRKAALHFLDERGVKATPQALERILAVAGGLDALENTCESLSLLVEKGGTLTGEQVTQAVGTAPGFDPFKLCDLATAGRESEACLMAARSLSDPAEMPRLVGLLARHYRILQLIRFHSRRDLRADELARLAGVSPYFLDGYRRAAGRHTPRELWEAQSALLNFDTAVKRGLPAIETAFLELIHALASKGRGGWPDFLGELPGA
ncbi:MAG: DNA polymerase III subunit delta [bacterium]|nr:DNA polymerase III subunit delta [bacterium]